MKIAESYAEVQEVARRAAGVRRPRRRESIGLFALLLLFAAIGIAGFNGGANEPFLLCMGGLTLAIGIIIAFNQTTTFSIDAGGFHKHALLPALSWDIALHEVMSIELDFGRDRLTIVTATGKERTLRLNDEQEGALLELVVNAISRMPPQTLTSYVVVLMASMAMLLVLPQIHTNAEWLRWVISAMRHIAWTTAITSGLVIAWFGYRSAKSSRS